MDDDDIVKKTKKAAPIWRRYGDRPNRPAAWCIKGIIPRTGSGLLSGQWGTFKTTIALDLSLSVMTGMPFADHYRVKHQGAVAYVAMEGAAMMERRLKALADARGIPDHGLPFFYRDTCPSLTDPDAAEGIIAQLPKDMPLSLVFIDTIATAAGYSKQGDDNDAAVTQCVMNTLAAVAKATGAFVLAIDHFGKTIETGTRGSSAKEGAVDTVLAALGSRDVNGTITDTRLALRKQRDGVSGIELPYTAEVVEIGQDEDGDPITAVTLTWNEQAKASTPEDHWPKSLRLFRRILVAAVAKDGRDIEADGASVRAVPEDVIRLEFYRQSLAETKDAKRMAFNRAVRNAQADNLVGVLETDGLQWIWLKG